MEHRKHIIILVHGLHGTRKDFATIKEDISRRFQDAIILDSRVNERLSTTDGVDTGGTRLAAEIETLLNTHGFLSSSSAKPQFSVIGHSLGGIFLRFAIGLLHQRGILDAVEPLSYISIATPHLGSRRSPRSTVFNWLASTFASYLIGRTGKHLMLIDTDGTKWLESTVATLPPSPASDSPLSTTVASPVESIPLLLAMSNPNSIFIQGLQRFQHCTAIANIHSDFQVPFCTASIQGSNPYDLSVKRQIADLHVVAFGGFADSYAHIFRESNIINLRPEVAGHLKEYQAKAQQQSLQPSSSASHPAPLNLLGSNDETFIESAEVKDLGSPSSASRQVLQSISESELGKELEAEGSNPSILAEGSHPFSVDNFRQIEYMPRMLSELQSAVHWRRIDIEMNNTFVHDLVVAKLVIPLYHSARPGKLFSHLLVTILAKDHGLSDELITEAEGEQQDAS